MQLNEDLIDPNLNLIFTHFNIPYISIFGVKFFLWPDGRRFHVSETFYIIQFKYVDQAISQAKDRISLISKKGN